MAARSLNAAADLVDDAGRNLERTGRYVDGVRGSTDGSTRDAVERADAALERARIGGGATTAVANTARDVSDRLRRVAQEFLDAEQAAMSHVGAVSRIGLAWQSMFSTGTWTARHVWSLAAVAVMGPLSITGAGKGVAAAIRPEGLPFTTGFLNKDTAEHVVSRIRVVGLEYDAIVYALAAAVAALEGIFGEPHASIVEARTDRQDPRRPAGVEDLMAGLETQENRMDGSVSIETITHADGSRSYVVTIPGTQDWGLRGENPVDAQGNLAGMAGIASDAQFAIVGAMRAAGIAPGDEVMLAGHSQGGINAMALASQPDFLDEFNVTHVVTAGSPVGIFDIPPSVQALHLEHTEDIVVGADGVSNPATATRTTVQRDLLLSDDPDMAQLGRTIDGAHHPVGYASTARAVDAGEAGKSATTWKDSASSFFSGQSSTLTEYVPVAPAQPTLAGTTGTASEPINVIPPPPMQEPASAALTQVCVEPPPQPVPQPGIEPQPQPAS